MANNFKKNKEDFLKVIPLLEPDEFVGLCTILKVQLMEEDGETPRDFVDMFSDVLDAFEKKNRTQRRNLLKILKAATKGKKLEDRLVEKKEEDVEVDTNTAAEA